MVVAFVSCEKGEKYLHADEQEELSVTSLHPFPTHVESPEDSDSESPAGGQLTT